MKRKQLIYFTYLLSLVTNLIAALNIVTLLELSRKNDGFWCGETLTQTAIVVGIVLIGFTFAQLAGNMQKGLVFAAKNQRLLLRYGIAVLVLNVPAYIGTTFFNPENLSSTAANLLTVGGISLLFFALVFKIGIKLQQEQDLTI